MPLLHPPKFVWLTYFATKEENYNGNRSGGWKKPELFFDIKKRPYGRKHVESMQMKAGTGIVMIQTAFAQEQQDTGSGTADRKNETERNNVCIG